MSEARAAAGPGGALRVCIFTETFHPVIGGGETQARILAEGLIARGVATCILTRRSDAALPVHDRVGDVAVRRLPPTGRGQLRKWGLLLSGVPALLRLRHEYDVVFVSGFRIIGVAAVIVARLLGKRVVLKADSQGEMSGEFFTAGLARFGVRATSLPFRAFLAARNHVLRRADAFAAITDDVAAELADAGIDRSITHRIPNAVDTRRFSPVDDAGRERARRRLDLPTRGRTVAYTGRLVSYKGLPLLLRAWSRVRAAHPDAVLLLIGTGGLDIHACEDALRATVRDHAMESSVVFTGSVENVHEYLHATDIFAFPTENDAFPSSVVEAMASGLPVITTRVGAIPEIVQDGETGILVEPGDLDAFVHGLDRLLSDAAFAARIGRAGLLSVLQRYSAEHVTDRYLELFAGLVRSGGPAGAAGELIGR